MTDRPHCSDYVAEPLGGQDGLGPMNLDAALEQYWTEEAARSAPASSSSSAQSTSKKGKPAAFAPSSDLPATVIKRMIRSMPKVNLVATETPVMMGKVAELFISELTMRAWGAGAQSAQHSQRGASSTPGGNQARDVSLGSSDAVAGGAPHTSDSASSAHRSTSSLDVNGRSGSSSRPVFRGRGNGQVLTKADVLTAIVNTDRFDFL